MWYWCRCSTVLCGLLNIYKRDMCQRLSPQVDAKRRGCYWKVQHTCAGGASRRLLGHLRTLCFLLPWHWGEYLSPQVSCTTYITTYGHKAPTQPELRLEPPLSTPNPFTLTHLPFSGVSLQGWKTAGWALHSRTIRFQSTLGISCLNTRSSSYTQKSSFA